MAFVVSNLKEVTSCGLWNSRDVEGMSVSMHAANVGMGSQMLSVSSSLLSVTSRHSPQFLFMHLGDERHELTHIR
jgi:hypothetical protein